MGTHRLSDLITTERYRVSELVKGRYQVNDLISAAVKLDRSAVEAEVIRLFKCDTVIVDGKGNIWIVGCRSWVPGEAGRWLDMDELKAVAWAIVKLVEESETTLDKFEDEVIGDALHKAFVHIQESFGISESFGIRAGDIPPPDILLPLVETLRKYIRLHAQGPTTSRKPHNNVLAYFQHAG